MPVVSGGKVIDQCGVCGKYVQLNKKLLGSLHLCDPEIARPVRTQQQQDQASKYLRSVRGAEFVAKVERLASVGKEK